MTIETIDIDLFLGIAKLHPNVIAQIFGYLPKCLLPHLLYFPPIREIAASVILSDVEITEDVERHMWFDGFRLCQCLRFNIKLDNLKQGIAQWNIYPHTFHMEHVEQFERVLDTLPKLITAALSINGTFYGKEGLDSKAMLNFFLDSNIMFDSIELLKFEDTLTLPSIARNVALHRTALDSYTIYGMKKLDIKIIPDDDDDDEGTQIFTFPASLEDLQIKTRLLTGVILPPTLRRLCLVTHLKQIEISSEGMPILEYLLLELPCIDVLNNNQIIAPNLKTLHLKKCLSMRGYNGLKKFQHLKHLTIDSSVYPFYLFDQNSLLELESFEYIGNDLQNSQYFLKSLLIFPPNLKHLSIKSAGLGDLDSSTLVLTPPLTRLVLLNVSFKTGYCHLDENLQYIHIITSDLTFHSSFRIPPRAEVLDLAAKNIVFTSLDFMYRLPNSLTRLQLLARSQGEMSPLTQKIKWPLVLGTFSLKGFSIDSSTLELLNLKESRLRKIEICKGNIQKLDNDLFPISVEELILNKMGIKELPESFENLENLRRLLLNRNQLEKVNRVKLPVSSLEHLELCLCNLRLVSPFLVSMYEEKNKDAKLKIHAPGNWNISVIDVRRTLKAIKGLSLLLSRYDETLEEISRRSSRLFAAFLTPDPYAPASEYSRPEEVISEYDSDDLYNGSLDNEYSDEDDEFYYGSSMEEDSSIVTSDNDKDS